jgi:phytoene dehydrogenase-like protein
MDKKAVVIGSGLAGLTMGAELVKAGYSVTIYEQNPFIGGVMSHAKKNGYEWEQGPLMLTAFEEGGNCKIILDGLGVHYDTVNCDRGSVFPDFALWKPENYAGPDWRKQRLAELFPAEKAGLDAYYRFYNHMLTLYDLQDQLELKDSLWIKARLLVTFLQIKKYASMSTQQLMDEFFRDPRLKMVFTGILADLCMRPSELTALGLPSLNIETAFDQRIPLKRGSLHDPQFTYIQGGTETIPRELGRVIEAGGGKICTGAAVEKVLVEDGKAVGVRLADGSQDRADLVIASGGAKELFCRLVGEQYLTPEYKQILDGIQPMEGVLMVHLGLDIDPLLYQKSALCYYYRTYDLDASVDKLRSGVYHGGDEGFLIYVPSTHGPNMAPEGRHAVTIYTVAPDTLKDGNWEEQKEQYADRLLELAEEHIPNLRAHVTERLIMAPPDMCRLAHLDRSSFGGLIPVMGKQRPPHVTPLKGLYFIGAQSESGGGVSTQIRAAHKLAAKITREKK